MEHFDIHWESRVSVDWAQWGKKTAAIAVVWMNSCPERAVLCLLWRSFWESSVCAKTVLLLYFLHLKVIFKKINQIACKIVTSLKRCY